MPKLHLLLTPGDAERLLARRLRAARKHRGWTQADLATRSALSIATVARLEQCGQGQVSSLLALCAALGQLKDIDHLLRTPEARSIDELRRRSHS